MKRRRLLITCVLLLLGGAIVNVAVAWALAALPSNGPLEKAALLQHVHNQMLGEWILAAQRRTVGRTHNWYHGGVVNDLRLSDDERNLTQTYHPSCGNDDSGPWDVVYPIRSTSWSRLGFIDLGNLHAYITAEIASGWPTLSLWGCMAGYDRDTGEQTHVGCIGLGQMQTTEYTDSHETCLPLRPLWPGFAINTIFYAAMLWVLFFVPGMVRRRIRRRRGLCPACAYPVGTSPVCTECGNQIPFPLRGRAREGVGRTETSNAHDDAERSTHPLAPSLKGGGKDPA